MEERDPFDERAPVRCVWLVDAFSVAASFRPDELILCLLGSDKGGTDVLEEVVELAVPLLFCSNSGGEKSKENGLIGGGGRGVALASFLALSA